MILVNNLPYPLILVSDANLGNQQQFSEYVLLTLYLTAVLSERDLLLTSLNFPEDFACETEIRALGQSVGCLGVF